MECQVLGRLRFDFVVVVKSHLLKVSMDSFPHLFPSVFSYASPGAPPQIFVCTCPDMKRSNLDFAAPLTFHLKFCLSSLKFPILGVPLTYSSSHGRYPIQVFAIVFRFKEIWLGQII